jgi:hypothetical protein
MNLFYSKTHRICHPDNSNGNDDYMMDYNPLLPKSIENDVDAAKARLNNHVTTEEEILTLDKDCEYCQIISKSSSGNEKYVYKIIGKGIACCRFLNKLRI